MVEAAWLGPGAITRIAFWTIRRQSRNAPLLEHEVTVLRSLTESSIAAARALCAFATAVQQGFDSTLTALHQPFSE